MTAHLYDCQQRINETYARYGFRGSGADDHGAGWGRGAYTGETWNTGLSDDNVISLARAANNGDKFAELFDRGNLTEYGGDHSRGDAALVGMIVFYTGPDPDQIDRIFRRSKLFRAKWDELRGTATYGEITIGNVLRLRGTDRESYYGSKRAESQTSSEQAKQRAFTLYTLDEYRRRPVPPPLIKGLIAKGAVAGLVGDFAAYKTFLALGMGLAVAYGVPWAGFDTEQAPVIYVAGEGGAGLVKRIDAFKKHHGHADDPPAFYLLDEPPRLIDGDAGPLLASIAALPAAPGFIVLDTVARTFGTGDENSAEDMSKYVAAVDRIKTETGATVLLLHHNNKQGGYRGSTALPGALDTMIAAEKTADGVVLRCEKQKDDEPFADIRLQKVRVVLNDLGEIGDETVIDLDRATSLVFVPAGTVPGEEEDLIVASLKPSYRKVLKALADSVMSWVSWSNLQAASRVSKSTMHEAASELTRRGFVETKAEGRSTYFRITDEGRKVFGPRSNPFEKEAADATAD